MHLTLSNNLIALKTLRQQLNLKRVDMFYNVFNRNYTLLLTLGSKMFNLLAGQVKMETTGPTEPAKNKQTNPKKIIH